MSQNLDLPCILYHLCAIFLDSQDKFLMYESCLW